MSRIPADGVTFAEKQRAMSGCGGGSSPGANRELRFCLGSLKFSGTFAEVLAYWRRTEYFGTAQLLS